MKCNDLLLYAVTDRSWLNGKTLAWQVEEALKGGITILQLREKSLMEAQEDFFKGGIYQEALEIQRLCRQYKVPFLINDQVEIACRMDADGVHVGQSDMAASLVREKIGKEKILGVSVQTVEQAVLAERQGADYLGVGAVFTTRSKADAQAVDRDTLCRICQAVSVPVVAIGGITEENMGQLEGTGICGVAMIRAIFAQTEIEQGVSQLLQKCRKLFEKEKGI